MSQFYMQEFMPEQLVTRADARMIRGATKRNHRTNGANRKDRNPGTPISRLADCEAPFRRMAFPGNFTG
jgi:hypothetical protein